MRIGITTFHRLHNYGAVLQAYALQQSIRRLGVDCEILDLLRPSHSGYRATPRSAPLVPYRCTNGSSRLSLGQQIKVHGRRLLEAMVGTRQRMRFQQFDQECFTYSRESFQSVDDLYAARLDYDAFVTGSDQVWNPTYSSSPEPYFLTFAKEWVPRIAYAPSFGVSQLDIAVHDQYRDWLNGITRLSVRERHGADLILEIAGRSAEVVLDPTLLLAESDWKKLAHEPDAQEPYIFCYLLGDDPDANVMRLCRHLQACTGHSIYRLGNVVRPFALGCKAILDAGPREFLGWIMNAAVVVTNSFHGTVFSVNMAKPFYVVPWPDRGRDSRNSRVESVLDTLGLRDRLWTPELPLHSVRSLDIAYDEVFPRLLFEREKSLRFLRGAILGNLAAEGDRASTVLTSVPCAPGNSVRLTDAGANA